MTYHSDTRHISKSAYKSSAEYHADTKRISKSMLTTFGKSRREYHKQYVLGVPKEVTSDQQLGTLVDLALLTPEKFETAFIVAPPEFVTKSGSVSESKAALAWVKENAGDKIVTTTQQLDQVANMVNALKEAIGHVLEYSSIQTTFAWNRDGYEFRYMSDIEIEYETVVEVIDIKTAKDAGVRNFGFDSEKYEYPLQHVQYSEGAGFKYPGKKINFSFLVVENGEADGFYRTAWHEIRKPDLIQQAIAVREWRAAKMRECYLTGDWKESWELRGKIGQGARPSEIVPRSYKERNNYEGDEN